MQGSWQSVAFGRTRYENGSGSFYVMSTIFLSRNLLRFQNHIWISFTVATVLQHGLLWCFTWQHKKKVGSSGEVKRETDYVWLLTSHPITFTSSSWWTLIQILTAVKFQFEYITVGIWGLKVCVDWRSVCADWPFSVTSLLVSNVCDYFVLAPLICSQVQLTRHPRHKT